MIGAVMTESGDPTTAAQWRRSAPRDARHLVVLVEDDPGDTILFRTAIESADPGLDLVTAGTVTEIGPLVTDAEPACIVLDLGLPGLTGFDALDEVVALAPEVAVVVLTGWGESHAVTEALVRGAQDYLVKGEVD